MPASRLPYVRGVPPLDRKRPVGPAVLTSGVPFMCGRGRAIVSRLTMFRKQFTHLQNACAFAEAIVNTVRETLVVLDQDLRVVAASR